MEDGRSRIEDREERAAFDPLFSIFYLQSSLLVSLPHFRPDELLDSGVQCHWSTCAWRESQLTALKSIS
jgi:hypothetical protein